MSFPTLQLVSAAMVLLSLRALVRAWHARAQLWREPLSANQLPLLTELALFVLVPLSVLLHEFGHMVAVWLAGGRVTGFGYLLFLGWVEYTGIDSPAQQFWIALSGNLVSVAVGLVAVAVGLGAPLRPVWSALLLPAGGMILATTLLFYPLFDILGGLGGDWTQLYGSPWPRPLVLGIAHAGLVGVGVMLWRSRWLRWRVSERVGVLWRVSLAERRSLLWRRLHEAVRRLHEDGWDCSIAVVEAVGSPVLEIRWTGANGPRSLRIQVSQRADSIDVVACAGASPVPRASWRAVVPDEVLLGRTTSLVPLLSRLKAAAEFLDAKES